MSAPICEGCGERMYWAGGITAPGHEVEWLRCDCGNQVEFKRGAFKNRIACEVVIYVVLQSSQSRLCQVVEACFDRDEAIEAVETYIDLEERDGWPGGYERIVYDWNHKPDESSDGDVVWMNADGFWKVTACSLTAIDEQTAREQ
jgi:hypothetical protein